MIPTILGRLSTSPSARIADVEPAWCIQNFRPGMMVQFHSGDITRTGWAEVIGVNYPMSRLEFSTPLSCIVPAVCIGDEMSEVEIPCQRCRCKRCQAERSGHT